MLGDESNVYVSALDASDWCIRQAILYSTRLTDCLTVLFYSPQKTHNEVSEVACTAPDCCGFALKLRWKCPGPQIHRLWTPIRKFLAMPLVGNAQLYLGLYNVHKKNRRSRATVTRVQQRTPVLLYPVTWTCDLLTPEEMGLQDSLWNISM